VQELQGGSEDERWPARTAGSLPTCRGRILRIKRKGFGIACDKNL